MLPNIFSVSHAFPIPFANTCISVPPHTICKHYLGINFEAHTFMMMSAGIQCVSNSYSLARTSSNLQGENTYFKDIERPTSGLAMTSTKCLIALSFDIKCYNNIYFLWKISKFRFFFIALSFVMWNFFLYSSYTKTKVIIIFNFITYLTSNFPIFQQFFFWIFFCWNDIMWWFDIKQVHFGTSTCICVPEEVI